MALQVIVTRPTAEADAWLDAFAERGIDALGLPLIDTGPPSDAATLTGLRHWQSHWCEVDAVMMVSPAAVRQFLGTPGFECPGGDQRLPRWWSPGPGSAKVLRRLLAEHGLNVGAVDTPADEASHFDSEALWSVVGSQVHPGFHLLVVRGRTRPDIRLTTSDPQVESALSRGEGREWLMERCQERGAKVDFCVAYERFAPDWLPEAQHRLAARPPEHQIWMLSSSEGVLELDRRMPEGLWRKGTALATHPRIAAAAREAGFRAVLCCKPVLEDVIRTLECHGSQIQ